MTLQRSAIREKTGEKGRLAALLKEGGIIMVSGKEGSMTLRELVNDQIEPAAEILFQGPF